MASEHKLVEFQIQPNYRRLGPRFGPRVKQVAAALAGLDAADAVRELDERGELSLELDGAVETLTPDDLNVRRTPREGFGVAEQDGVIVAVATDMSTTSWPARAWPASWSTPPRASAATRASKSQTEFGCGSPAPRVRSRRSPLPERERARERVNAEPLIAGNALNHTLTEHQAWIAGEVLAVAVNDGEPPDDSAQAEHTLNGVPVEIRLSRA